VGLGASFGQLGNASVAEELSAIEAMSRTIAQTFPPNDPLPPCELSALFKMNRRLRELFDQGSMRQLKSFDDNYKPTQGWEAYYEFYE
jgi:hypothetical protein